MPNQQLLDYIKQQVQQGLTKDQIKNSLLSNSFQEQEVDEALSSSTPPNQPTTQNKVPQPSSPRQFKTLKIILGIATLWPISFICTNMLLTIFVGIIMIGTWGFGPGGTVASFLMIPLTTLYPILTTLYPILLYPTIILYIIISLIFIAFTFKNKKFPKNQKIIWIIIFSAGFFIATTRTSTTNIYSFFDSIPLTPIMPIYWYMYIWKEPKQKQLP